MHVGSVSVRPDLAWRRVADVLSPTDRGVMQDANQGTKMSTRKDERVNGDERWVVAIEKKG